VTLPGRSSAGLGDATHPGKTAVVRDIIDALNRADVEGVLDRIHPDFEWKPLEGSPAAGACQGHAQVRRYVQDWLDTIDALHLDLQDPIEMGNIVIVEINGHGRGRTSGVELSNHFWQVWTLDGGTPLRMYEYRTREEALRAATDAAASGTSSG
jgi:ketosteroid isomerase-like protein